MSGQAGKVGNRHGARKQATTPAGGAFRNENNHAVESVSPLFRSSLSPQGQESPQQDRPIPFSSRPFPSVSHRPRHWEPLALVLRRQGLGGVVHPLVHLEWSDAGVGRVGEKERTQGEEGAKRDNRRLVIRGFQVLSKSFCPHNIAVIRTKPGGRSVGTLLQERATVASFPLHQPEAPRGKIKQYTDQQREEAHIRHKDRRRQQWRHLGFVFVVHQGKASAPCCSSTNHAPLLRRSSLETQDNRTYEDSSY